MSSHLYLEVSAQLLAATPTAHWIEYVDWADPILQEPLKVVDGWVTPPDRPGTGLAWDPDAVAHFRHDQRTRRLEASPAVIELGGRAPGAWTVEACGLRLL
jgi:L-alanine-DL-glutamate epimerase-like enolase superfamily enzyme